MQRTLIKLGGIAAATLLGLTAAQAQGTIKIGLVMSYTGQFGDLGTMMDTAVKLYVKKYGDTVAGKKIEFIRKDSGAAGSAPDVAKRLVQELIVRDNVDIIAGFSLTPDALASADVLTESKKPAVIMNAATAIITARSPYFVRTSIPLPAAMGALGTWAAKTGIKKSYTMVTDYGPGIDSEQAFQAAFKEGGGEIVGSVRFPVVSPDFSAFVQRLKDSKSESVFIFVPGGEQPASLGKALAEHGLSPKTTKVLASGELTNEAPLKSMGPAAEGIISAWHYDWRHKSAMNDEFTKGFREMLNGRNPDQFSVSAWDGMHAIYEALRKTNGNTNGDAFINALKGHKWESPRGQILIDPETRDIVQTVYLRRVEKIGNEYGNNEFDKLDNVKDPVKAKLKAEGKLTDNGLTK
ncbi:MAG TPA: ABC transporter substrate-binding protein [Xanthobacteraceae bacterium]|nr:ABC transporter substrate-binding protein [Xanthobacteraceae bacterium]